MSRWELLMDGCSRGEWHWPNQILLFEESGVEAEER